LEKIRGAGGEGIEKKNETKRKDLNKKLQD